HICAEHSRATDGTDSHTHHPTEEFMTMSVKIQRENHGKSEAGRANRLDSTTMDPLPLIDGLNHDLAGEYQAVLMYTHYSAKLTGPYRRELRALFQAGVADELGHAQFLAGKISALGGEPPTEPRPVPAADEPLAMLEHARAAEAQAIADYG